MNHLLIGLGGLVKAPPPFHHPDELTAGWPCQGRGGNPPSASHLATGRDEKGFGFTKDTVRELNSRENQASKILSIPSFDYPAMAIMEAGYDQ